MGVSSPTAAVSLVGNIPPFRPFPPGPPSSLLPPMFVEHLPPALSKACIRRATWSALASRYVGGQVWGKLFDAEHYAPHVPVIVRIAQRSAGGARVAFLPLTDVEASFFARRQEELNVVSLFEMLALFSLAPE